jgi:trans-2,3-dihydro-3-hydroxyanthranilate isomerase
MTRSYRYLHYDVFTDRALEGNQLAVFPDPAGLTTELMQAITREMNFSECTFIFPPEAAGTNVRMRIFTPGEELPMAGHPTIGSTFALAKERVIKSGQRDFVFGLGVGPTPVDIEWKGGAIDFAWMTQGNPRYGGAIGGRDAGATADRTAFAASIGLEVSDLASAAPEAISCGNLFLIAPLASRDAVDRVEINRIDYAKACAAAGLDELPLFVFSLEDGEVQTYSRMLGPGLGVTEDPATGSAAGPLGCYLYKHRLLPRERLSHIVNAQGVKMLRPSRIHISIEGRGDEITRVRVGGRSVLVGEGSLTI